MTRPSARERLIETASALLYELGITNVGIREITDKAGVAKMTLYNCFADKEELVLAVLNEHLTSRRAAISDACENGSLSSREKLQRLFEIAETAKKDENFRGCIFLNAALQTCDPASAVHALVKKHKLWIKDKIKEIIAADFDDANSEIKAQQILALWDGSISEAYIQQSQDPINCGLSCALEILTPRHGEKVKH